MSEEIYKAARLQRLAAKTLPKKITGKGNKTDAIRRRMHLEDQAANPTDFRRLNRPGAGPSGVTARDISPFGKAEEIGKRGRLARTLGLKPKAWQQLPSKTGSGIPKDAPVYVSGGPKPTSVTSEMSNRAVGSSSQRRLNASVREAARKRPRYV